MFPRTWQFGRPVVHDGVLRGRSSRLTAVAAIPCPKIYSNISCEDALPAVRTPGCVQPACGEGGEDEGCPGGKGEASRPRADDESECEGAAAEGYDDLVSANKGYRYNIDVAPKINLSMGPLIKALLKSGVGRYLEFMPLQYTFLHQSETSKEAGSQQDGTGCGSLQRVPMSKADIFQAKSITPIEKRLLMKFLQWCVVRHENEENTGRRWLSTNPERGSERLHTRGESGCERYTVV